MVILACLRLSFGVNFTEETTALEDAAETIAGTAAIAATAATAELSADESAESDNAQDAASGILDELDMSDSEQPAIVDRSSVAVGEPQEQVRMINKHVRHVLVWAIDGDLEWAKHQYQLHLATSKALAVRSKRKLISLLTTAISQADDTKDIARKVKLREELREYERDGSDTVEPAGGKRLRTRNKGVGKKILAPPVTFLRRSEAARSKLDDASSSDDDFEDRLGPS